MVRRGCGKGFLGDKSRECPQNLQLNHASAHVVVGAAFGIALKEMGAEDHALFLGFTAGDPAEDMFVFVLDILRIWCCSAA